VHAVVLVGGFGTRLRPLTNDVPKPMLPVLHRPMIERLVERLASGGVTDVVLALGFKPEPFAEAFPHGRHGDVRVHYAVEPEPLDTAGAIAFAARACDVTDRFVVANGDIVSDLDVAALVGWHADRHRRFGVEATIHLTPVDDPSAFGVVEVDGDGLVDRFIEKPAPGTTESSLINAGTYVLEPGVVDLVEPGRRMSIERAVFPQLAAGRCLAGVATGGYWLDTGTPELYLRANLDMLDGSSGPLDTDPIDPTASIGESATLVHVIAAAGAVIGAGAHVTRSVLLPGAVVAAGAVVADSVVAGHIGPGATVRNCVIGRTGTVAGGSSLADARVPQPE
jgi:mannose-1-phosphate guanylyltransferase